MDFVKAAALAAAWVEIVSEGRAILMREATIAKAYGWIFFYQSSDFLETGHFLAIRGGNAPIIVDRNTNELRVTGTAKPWEEYVQEYEKSLPLACLRRAPEIPRW